MKLTSRHEISNYTSQTAVTGAKKHSDKAHRPAGAPTQHQEEVTVNLSQRSKAVQKAKEAVHSVPDVRLERVQVIKEKIEKGTYETDHAETAERMLIVFLDEIV